MTPHERDANPAERMEMLGYAQDIECLSLDYSMAEFEMKGVTIGKDQRSGYFFVRINTELKFPETFRDLSLSLSPTGNISQF